MAKSARECALLILERCRRKQAFSDALLGSVVSSERLSQRDSGLCTRICYGVLQNMALCDFYIDHFSKNKKIEPKVRDILRISVYQILFLDKVPNRAAVSEGVNLCKKSGFSRASGFVNAVLRKISTECENLPSIPNDDKIEYLSIAYSTPINLVNLFIDDYGFEFSENLLKANNEQPPITVQVNTLKVNIEELKTSLETSGVNCKNHDFVPNCLDINGSGNIDSIAEHEKGYFYVQDAAARLSVIAANPQPNDLVLDACSAPGGKSFSTAIAMQNKGKIISCDIHENKLKRIEKTAKRLGINIIETLCMDASNPLPEFKEKFDLVIADVPCSGFGVIRKKPDIRYKDLDNLDKLPSTQLSILEGLSKCVKVGGTILYSTCTILKRENFEVIDKFLSEHNNFVSEQFYLPEPIGTVTKGKIGLYPNIHNTDGFFICKLRKINEN